MIALKLLKILRDDYIHGELDKDINEAIIELEETMNLTRREWYQKGFNEAMKQRACYGCKYAYYDDECEEYYYSSDIYECRDCYRSGYKDNFMEKDNA